uniref:DUF4781 domain-containing protein n=1 Tax=Anopheles minimus TaxID=112268 RepID=A0A182VR17_9DIPT
MSSKHIARIMCDFLHRGVQRNEEDIFGFNPAEEFYKVKTKPYAVNLIAFALGKIPPELVSLDEFERADLLTDRKLRSSLIDLVDRMPALEFQFIPLVLVHEDRVDISFLLRVRKAANAKECIYLDLTNRKYDRFTGFLTQNKLPSCTLWYPEDGLLRYDHSHPAGPLLVIASRKVSCTGSVWDGVTLVGSALSMVLAFTPVGATVTVPLLVATSAFSSGRSVVNLVDSCQHEKGTVVAGRAFALALNLTTFASAGLTAVCRMEKLRRVLPVEKLLRLEQAEKLLSGTMRSVAAVGAINAVIGKVGGWQTLSTEEWMELAAILCFAYREHFDQQNARRLFGMMQCNGVYQFFKNLCPNVPLDILRARIDSPMFAHFLRLVMEFLGNNVQFKVDDNFAKIDLYGYKLQFDLLFKINWPQLKALLLFLQSSTATLINFRAQTSWTQLNVDDAVQFMELVSRIPGLFCKLAEYITLGHGHRFTIGTVRLFLTAKQLNRTELLKQLSLLSGEETNKLNELRESGRITGGDLELFNWLGHYGSSYRTALLALIAVADAQTSLPCEKSHSINFDNGRIIVSPLLGFMAKDFLNVPVRFRTILLGDESFLRLCCDDEKRQLAGASDVWMRTIASDTAIHQLETVGLLGQLFERVGPSSTGSPTLTAALDYALGFENPTVPQVYYSIVAAWKQFTVPLDKGAQQARFLQLMKDAKSLGMVRELSVPGNGDAATNDEDIIALARTALLADIKKWSIPFGPVERAACWLQFLPILRNKVGRARLSQTIASLASNGTGSVLKSDDRCAQYREIVDKRMVMFVRNKDKMLVEVVFPCAGCDRFRISLYMCGSTITDCRMYHN